MPLLLGAVIAVSAGLLPGTLAVMTERTAPLVNTFCPDERVHASGEVQVEVLKTVRNLGKKSMLPQGFSFVLTDTAQGDTLTASTAANGRAVFCLSFCADDVGTHIYRLTEVKGALPGVTYSELVYTLQVEVALQDTLQLTVYLDGVKTDAPLARFENLYNSTKDPRTGDTVPLLPCSIVLLAGLVGIVLLFQKAKRYAA